MKKAFGRGGASRAEGKRLVWTKTVVVLGEGYKGSEWDGSRGDGRPARMWNGQTHGEGEGLSKMNSSFWGTAK